MHISYAVRPEVAGGFGDGTQLDSTVHPPRVSRLHYEFTGWSGDDIVESFPCFIVTDRLADALDISNLSGFDLDEVAVTKDPQFEEFFPAVAAELPSWQWLRVIGDSSQDDFWLDDQAILHVSDRALALLQTFHVDCCEFIET